MSELIIPGDYVVVSRYGSREGLVIGSHYDSLGRHILEVEFEPRNVYHAYYPTVTRVRRTTTYYTTIPERRNIVERRVYW
ncbi:hypothetical protein M422DRAFT_23275 [Sphaerobolus stellatus SS14]|nr:hypothetical protein M422DRAFT_23275 [Sphaerobolus stellatus SS14]